MERCRREIAAIEAEILAGNPDLPGLCLALGLVGRIAHPSKQRTPPGRNPAAQGGRDGREFRL